MKKYRRTEPDRVGRIRSAETSAEPFIARPPAGDGEAQASDQTPKFLAHDGLADHQRNPLAPPINIKSNG